MQDEEAPKPVLSIDASIGFNKLGTQCLTVHPSDMHILWATGSTIVIKSIDRPTNRYLKGHEGPIVGICCSPDGKLMATGEQQYPGAQAALIVWDFDTFEMVFRVRYHKDCV